MPRISALKFIITIFLLCTFFASCFSQKSKSKIIPSLEIKILHEWEKVISETSIYEGFSINSNEIYYSYSSIHPPQKNTFILHYKIATVEKISIVQSDSLQEKKTFTNYKLFYDTLGNLTEANNNQLTTYYLYDNQGNLDSSYTLFSSLNPIFDLRFTIGKEVKTWDRVKGKTGWLRLTEREIYDSRYIIKKKKTEYYFLAKIQYLYENDGLLSEIKSFDAKGNLTHHSKFIYTFYKNYPSSY